MLKRFLLLLTICSCSGCVIATRKQFEKIKQEEQAIGYWHGVSDATTIAGNIITSKMTDGERADLFQENEFDVIAEAAAKETDEKLKYREEELLKHWEYRDN